MPKIFLFCLPTGMGSGAVHGSTRGGDVIAHALAEDGTALASHWSSSVGFAQHDIGLTSDWNHDAYRKHYPDGYEVVWAGSSDDELDAHAEFSRAFELNQARASEMKEDGADVV